MRKLLIASLLGLSALTAQAQSTIYGSNFGSSNTYSTTFAGGVGATFNTAPTSSNFQLKSGDGITGVGVSGATAGEVDRGESILATFSQGIEISNIRLGLLFDGPEYGDVNEVAQITAYWAAGGSTSFTLVATGTNTAIWSGAGSVTSFGSGAVNGGTGAWDLSNPFGNQKITGLAFTALTGIAGAGCTSCTNQSDYTLVSITAVPEAESFAMMLAGLGLMGTIARRRKASQA